MQHKLKSYDESQPDLLRAKITTQPESISIHFPSSNREILIEQSSGVLQVRAYDGERDSPLSTLIPVLGPMYVESYDYEFEIKQIKHSRKKAFKSISAMLSKVIKIKLKRNQL